MQSTKASSARRSISGEKNSLKRISEKDVIVRPGKMYVIAFSTRGPITVSFESPPLFRFCSYVCPTSLNPFRLSVAPNLDLLFPGASNPANSFAARVAVDIKTYSGSWFELILIGFLSPTMRLKMTLALSSALVTLHGRLFVCD